jgi:uncharacterized membrane protein YoaT (DUF817 family)
MLQIHERIADWGREFLVFGLKQARAAVFAGSFFVVLFASSHIPLFGLARYDFLFVAALLIQVVLVRARLETKDEAKVIFLFHIVGLVLEIYKTHPMIGSWSYPEPGLFKIAGVPIHISQPGRNCTYQLSTRAITAFLIWFGGFIAS